MILLDKLQILTPLQKLPKYLVTLAKTLFVQGLKLSI